MENNLIQKYNVAGPRYTSYPTVPYWDESFFGVEAWKSSLIRSFEESDKGISLYIHLPFCESMCTFCGCFKRITKNHSVEEVYIKAVLREWRLYCALLGERPVIRELHLGGGTPTFFSPKNLEDLINGILAMASKAPDCEMSFEGHPNNTTRQHLQKLYDLGFRRVSFGVQDYSPKVQQAINRIQSLASVAKVTVWARQIGYTSIGHDIIYGLPFQTTENIVDTIEKTNALRPDRLAFYSYAHVPWIKGNGQRGFRDEDIPTGAVKRDLYETGKELLLENGYREIGMDHFALESDTLYDAMRTGTLHRNFMGYSSFKTQLMIGLGVSAISDSWYGFAQNVKNLEDYYQMLEWDALPVVKGHILTGEDLVVRKHILNLMCQFETSWENIGMRLDEMGKIKDELQEMEHDGLIAQNGDRLIVTERGKPFLRNICMAFDLKLKRQKPDTTIFSMTI